MFVLMNFTLGKQERLKSKKLIEKLYADGIAVKSYPLRMVYIETAHTSDFPAQVGFSVPKRNFKSAVDRNRLKRLLRETYRKQKHFVYENLNKQHVFMISYLAKEELSYADIEKKMLVLLEKFINKIKEENDKK